MRVLTSKNLWSRAGRPARAANAESSETSSVRGFETALVLVLTVVVVLATETSGLTFGPPSLMPLLGCVILLATPTAVALRRGTFSLLGPELVLPVAFYLATLHSPVTRLVLNRPLERSELEVVRISVFASGGIAIILVALGRKLEKLSRPLPPLADVRAAERLALAGVVVSLAGLILFGVWASEAGFQQLFAASYADVYLLAAGSTAFTFAWPFCCGGLATTSVAIARWPGQPPPIWGALNVLLLLAFIGISGRLGMRGPIIELLVALALVRKYTARPVTKRETLRVLVLLATVFLLISAMRRDLAAGFGVSSDQIDASVGEGTNPDAPTEFDFVFENHAEITRLAGTVIPFREGETYLELPLQMIPRQFLAEKPPPLSVWWIRYVDPEAADAGAGRAFGSFAEGYLNFGPVGAVSQILAVTLFLLLFQPLLRSTTAGMASAAAQVIAHSYHAHRGEALNLAFVSRNALLSGLAIYVLYEVLRIWQTAGSATKIRPMPHRLPAQSAATRPSESTQLQR